LPFDVHLMVEDNEFFVRQFADIGVQYISVHAESALHLDRVLGMIREQGAKAGVALNPATPVSALDYVRERLDFVLIMTVNPGFAGQTLVPAGLRKIGDCRAYLEAHGVTASIEVDGNVSFEHIPGMVAAGADILVAGSSSVFAPGAAFEDNVLRVRELLSRGLRARGGGESA
jgi:ribulose-phosphate 3-epimerase